MLDRCLNPHRPHHQGNAGGIRRDRRTTRCRTALRYTKVLGRGPDAALFLGEVQAYSTGVLFSAALRLRRRMDGNLPNMHMELMGVPARNAEAGDPEERLMVGVQFADDRPCRPRRPAGSQNRPIADRPLLCLVLRLWPALSL